MLAGFRGLAAPTGFALGRTTILLNVPKAWKGFDITFELEEQPTVGNRFGNDFVDAHAAQFFHQGIRC